MTLRDILRAKGSDIYSTVPGVTLDRVAQILVEHNCGSLLVRERPDAGRMLGIITERDILRVCARGWPLDQTPVETVMTTAVITGQVDEPLEQIMGRMTHHRVRHLPLIESGDLAGLISIGDVVKAQHDRLTAENHYLKTYIHG
jgi:CBS domain-containing protein